MNLQCGDFVKVVALEKGSTTNLYGVTEDITCFIGEVGVISNVLGNQRYSVEFKEITPAVSKIRTGYTFSETELKKQSSESTRIL